jgi:hypothetical protein
MRTPNSRNCLRPIAARTWGNQSRSSSLTWWRTFSIRTVTLASKFSASGVSLDSSDNIHITTWCSSTLSSTWSVVCGTASRAAG